MASRRIFGVSIPCRNGVLPHVSWIRLHAAPCGGGGAAGVKEEPPVQGKAKGIAGEVLPPALVWVLRARATVPTRCALVPPILCFR